MALATQCPHCYTSFRVANDQLKLHAGLVRCGSCKRTFNGIEHLLAPGQEPRKAPQPESSSAVEGWSPSTEVEVASQNVATNTKRTDHQLSDALEQADRAKASNSSSNSSSNNAQNSIATKQSVPAQQQAVTTNHDQLVEEESAPSTIPEPHSTNQDYQESAGLAFDNDTTDEVENGLAHSNDTELDFDTAEAIKSVEETIESSDFDTHQQRIEPTFEFEEEKEEVAEADSSLDDANTEHVGEVDSSTIAGNEQALQHNLMQQFSAQLETIEPELGVSPAKIEQEKKSASNKARGLTTGLEFELTKEEQELVEQADLLHQLELENRAAILDEDAQEWSKHEPSFDEKSLLAAFAADEALRSQGQPSNATPPIKPTFEEAIESTKDNTYPEKSDFDDDAHLTPEFVLQAEKKRRYGKWQTIGLSLACVFLTLGIAAQSAYFLRSTIAAEIPTFKPQLLRACQVLSCQINLPADRQMLEIAGSELLILNEELKLNTLAFQLQNKSTTVQEWPVVELTLEDVRGKTVLQKVFSPTDYVKNKADIAKGMTARSESDHKLYFELNANKASNYKVSFFYP